MDLKYTDIDWLRANHEMIHYFGLGFIQLKLDPSERMHFYIPELDPIVPPEDVHNHRYDFTSTILKGELTQQLFDVKFSDFGDHELEDVTCVEGETSEKHPGAFTLTHSSTHTYCVGSAYYIDHNQFHRVIPTGIDGCITLLRRGGYMKERAQVVRPINGRTVCPFSRKIPEAELWQFVERALK